MNQNQIFYTVLLILSLVGITFAFYGLLLGGEYLFSSLAVLIVSIIFCGYAISELHTEPTKSRHELDKQ